MSTERQPETIRQAAERTGVPLDTLHNWRRIHRLTPVGKVRVGPRLHAAVYRPGDIDAAVSKQSPPAGWLTVKQLADATGKAVNTIHKLLGEGRLKTEQRGRIHYLPPDALDNVPPPHQLPKCVRGPINRPKAKDADDDRDGRTPDDGYGPEVPFGRSGLTLFAADLSHLERVQAGRLARAGREGK